MTTPPPPWVVISTTAYVAGLVLITGFDTVPMWVLWPMRGLDVVAGIGLGTWASNLYEARRKGRP